MIQPIQSDEGKLPFPTRPLKVRGGTVEEYVIPEEKKAEVLEQLYLFDPVPDLDEIRYDLHEHKLFRVGDLRISKSTQRFQGVSQALENCRLLLQFH